MGCRVNITHYNANHVFTDLKNEVFYKTLCTQLRTTIERKLMTIKACTPFFPPKEDTRISLFEYYRQPYHGIASKNISSLPYLNL